MGTVLWLAAVLLVIIGIVELLQGALVLGIVLIVFGLLVGPGGVSITNGRRG
ncbi:MAG: GPGG-motif small membrane protein [Marmoricola sp.]